MFSLNLPIFWVKSPNGAQVGPIKGPKIQPAIASPLFSNGTISAIVPAPSVIGELAAIPAKKRNTIKLFRLLATAQAILKTRKMKLQIL
jgi:hypothetical protein